MSAMTSTMTFAGQNAFRASAARRSAARRSGPAAPRRVQICCGAPAQHEGRQGANPIKLLVAGFAAAALLHGGVPAPAQAGVIMVKTEKKKVFQDDGAPKAAPAAKAEAKSDGGSLSLPSLEFNAAFLALPITIGGIGVLGLAVSKLDKGFNAFFDDVIVKNSNRDGFGYETYKTNGVPTKLAGAKAKASGGTKRVTVKGPAAKKFSFPSFLKK